MLGKAGRCPLPCSTPLCCAFALLWLAQALPFEATCESSRPVREHAFPLVVVVEGSARNPLPAIAYTCRRGRLSNLPGAWSRASTLWLDFSPAWGRKPEDPAPCHCCGKTMGGCLPPTLPETARGGNPSTPRGRCADTQPGALAPYVAPRASLPLFRFRPPLPCPWAAALLGTGCACAGRLWAAFIPQVESTHTTERWKGVSPHQRRPPTGASS